MPSETWITNATLVTQNETREIIQGHLRIQDGRIAEIKKRLPKKLPDSAKVIDAQGLHVLPGLVQAHVHLCQTLFRNQADDLELLDWLSKRIWIFEAAHDAETLHTSALLGIHELLSSGTTCLLDMGTVRHTDSIFEAVRETGIRASVGKCLMDHPTTTPEYLREPTQDAVTEAMALYKKWHGRENDRIRVSYAPRFVISCTEKLLRKVLEASRSQNALVHTHASENLKEIQLVKELVHCENVEYLHQLGLTSPNLVLAHCIWLKPNEKEILQRTGTHVTHCPSSNMKLASGLAHVQEMRARGINVALGADGAPCNNNLDMFAEMRLAALIHKPMGGPQAMQAQEVLDMATRNGAKALGWFSDIGSIEVGKKADLIALDLRQPENAIPAFLYDGERVEKKDPLIKPEAIASSIVYSSSRRHLRFTMVDGKVLYQAGNTGMGKVRGIRSEALVEKLLAAQRRIASRISTVSR